MNYLIYYLLTKRITALREGNVKTVDPKFAFT